MDEFQSKTFSRRFDQLSSCLIESTNDFIDILLRKRRQNTEHWLSGRHGMAYFANFPNTSDLSIIGHSTLTGERMCDMRMRLCEIEHVHSPSSRVDSKHCSLIVPVCHAATAQDADYMEYHVCCVGTIVVFLQRAAISDRLNSNNTLAHMHTQIHGTGRFISRSAVKHLHATDRVKCWLFENMARPMRLLLICFVQGLFPSEGDIKKIE